jgi:hypothetical protein
MNPKNVEPLARLRLECSATSSLLGFQGKGLSTPLAARCALKSRSLACIDTCCHLQRHVDRKSGTPARHATATATVSWDTLKPRNSVGIPSARMLSRKRATASALPLLGDWTGPMLSEGHPG